MCLLHLSPTQKRIISKIAPFGFICCLFGIIWSLVERSLLGKLDHYPATGLPYEFSSAIITTSFGSLIFGWIIGSIEILFLNKFFVGRSFGSKILIKTIIYIISLSLFLISLTIIFTSITSNVSIFDSVVLDSIAIFVMTFSFWGVIIYMGAVIGIMLFFSEVSDNLGQGVLKNFPKGQEQTKEKRQEKTEKALALLT